MTSSKHNIALTTAPLAVIKRRPVGKGAWKVTVQEIIESEQRGIQTLRAIGDKRPLDGDLQRLVAIAALEAAERMSKLSELLHYREEKEPNGDTP